MFMFVTAKAGYNSSKHLASKFFSSFANLSSVMTKKSNGAGQTQKQDFLLDDKNCRKYYLRNIIPLIKGYSQIL